MIAPAPTTTRTITVASASTEARVSYQLFQSSSMRWPPSKARAQPQRKSRYVERTASKNAMLRFVARVLIARQHDLCRTAWGASDVVPKFVRPPDSVASGPELARGGIPLTPTTIPSACSSVSSLTWKHPAFARLKSVRREPRSSERRIASVSSRSSLWPTPPTERLRRLDAVSRGHNRSRQSPMED